MIQKDIFPKEDPVFSRKRANKLILKIRHGSKDSLVDNSKKELFILMKKVVVKNVNNYLKLFRNSKVSEFSFEEEEVYSEAFLIMMNCVEKFNVKRGNCFYFYYNKAMSRQFYRMLERRISRSERRDVFIEHSLNTGDTSTSSEGYSVDFVLNNLDFTEEEKRLIRSRIEKQTRKDFLEENQDISSNDYSVMLKQIKEKLNKIKEHDKL